MIKSFAHDAVDAVQKAKLQFVSTFVKHEGLAETMTKFVEAQSQYTKSALSTNIDAMMDFSMALTKKDFAKELVSAYGFDKFVPTVSATSKKAK
jgi:N-methylhydantoinase B/oxoprolinase/acetone carboxylase alpha subunit